MTNSTKIKFTIFSLGFFLVIIFGLLGTRSANAANCTGLITFNLAKGSALNNGNYQAYVGYTAEMTAYAQCASGGYKVRVFMIEAPTGGTPTTSRLLCQMSNNPGESYIQSVTFTKAGIYRFYLDQTSDPGVVGGASAGNANSGCDVTTGQSGWTNLDYEYVNTIGTNTDPDAQYIGQSCVYGNVTGTCQYTKNCSNPFPGTCPGSSAVQCCQNPSTPNPTPPPGGGNPTPPPGGGNPTPQPGGSSDFSIQPYGPKSLTDLLNVIITWIFNIAIPIAVIMIIYAGLQILTAGGNPAKYEKGKKTLGYAVLGLAIIFIGKGFISLIKSILELGSK